METVTSNSLLFQAFQVILNGGTIVAIHKGRYYRDDKGLSLGAGPFVAALEYASELKAEVVGKPNETFFLQALGDVTKERNEVIMIGDVREKYFKNQFVEFTTPVWCMERFTAVLLNFPPRFQDYIDDIQGALRLGVGAILVKTGKYLAGDETKCDPHPNACVTNFSAAVDFILEHNASR